MTEHTQEPWTATDIGTLHGADGQFIAELGGMRAEADLSRIVACVNACAGLHTAELERIAALDATLARVKAMRQALIQIATPKPS